MLATTLFSSNVFTTKRVNQYVEQLRDCALCVAFMTRNLSGKDLLSYLVLVLVLFVVLLVVVMMEDYWSPLYDTLTI